MSRNNANQDGFVAVVIVLALLIGVPVWIYIASRNNDAKDAQNNTSEVAQTMTKTEADSITVTNSINKHATDDVYEYWFTPSKPVDIRVKLYDTDGKEVEYLLNKAGMTNGAMMVRTMHAPVSQGGIVSSFSYSIVGDQTFDYPEKKPIGTKYEN